MIRLFIILTCICTGISSCTTSTQNLSYGTSESYIGYVPARIAVLPCAVWPAGARYRYIPLSNTSSQVADEVCARFDEFVRDGFKDQPYMRGYSPAMVAKFLESAGAQKLLAEGTDSWRLSDNACLECKNPQSYYVSSISPRMAWRQWLIALSKNVKNADAVLLPFVVTTSESTLIDRGVRVKRRFAFVSLLLVDTNNGLLLWSGGREAFAQNQAEFSNAAAEQALDFPPWSTVTERLLVDDVWKDFPGRQVYR